MILLTLLALAGVLLLVMEILISGFGLFGFSGSIALILSLTLTTVKYGFTTLFALLVISLLFAFFLIHFLKSKKEKLILQDVLKAKDFDETLLQGQPYGIIEVEGKKIDVTSNEGYIDKNRAVQVIQVKGKTVTVKQI